MPAPAVLSFLLTIFFLGLPRSTLLLSINGKESNESIVTSGGGPPESSHFGSKTYFGIQENKSNDSFLNSPPVKLSYGNAWHKSSADEDPTIGLGNVQTHPRRDKIEQANNSPATSGREMINADPKGNAISFAYNTDQDEASVVSDEGMQASTTVTWNTQENERLEKAIQHLSKPLISSQNNSRHKEENTHQFHDNKTGSVCNCRNTVCDCSSRALYTVPQNLPTTITVLLLSNNLLNKLPNCSFCSYTALETLDLGFNAIESLEVGSFFGLSHLKSLSLEANKMDDYTLPPHVFKPLQSLKLLKINCMYLNAKQLDEVLMDLQNLQELHISALHRWKGDKYFGPGFQNLTSLQSLTMTCGISRKAIDFDPPSFEYLSQLTFLNLSYTYLTAANGTFAPLQNLLLLDVSDSYLGMENLPTILWGLTESKLKILNISSIVLASPTHLDRKMFEYLPSNLESLIVSGNDIVTTDGYVLSSLPDSLKYFDLSGNVLFQDPWDMFQPLSGLPNLTTLLMNNQAVVCITHSRRHDPVGFGSDVTQVCKKGKGYHGQKNRNWQPFPMLKKLGMTFYDALEFYFDRIDIEILEASHSDLTYIPKFTDKAVPHLLQIDFKNSGIKCLSDGSSQLIQLNALKSLNLGSNLLGETIELYREWGPFDKLPNLTHLDLSDNQIRDMPLNIFRNLHKMEQLRLDRNLISQLDVDLSNLSNLKLLNLSNTDISYLPVPPRQHIDRQCQKYPGEIRVDMTNCPILCSCSSLDFLRWMATSKAFDLNSTGYMCRYPDSSTKRISDQYHETIQILNRQCAENYPVFLFALASTLILLCGMVGANVYRFRWTLRYWYYAAYIKIKGRGERDDGKEFLYDVFVSYDGDDQQFVASVLLPELEQRGLKLLIHGRDFVAGTPIGANITNAISDSRKTLVVLTQNLLGSCWCEFEIEMANVESVDTGRQVLVFLLKDSIPMNDLGRTLTRYIRKNTYIPYPQPEMETEEINEDILRAFWDKLAHDLRS